MTEWRNHNLPAIWAGLQQENRCALASQALQWRDMAGSLEAARARLLDKRNVLADAWPESNTSAAAFFELIDTLAKSMLGTAKYARETAVGVDGIGEAISQAQQTIQPLAAEREKAADDLTLRAIDGREDKIDAQAQRAMQIAESAILDYSKKIQTPPAFMLQVGGFILRPEDGESEDSSEWTRGLSASETAARGTSLERSPWAVSSETASEGTSVRREFDRGLGLAGTAPLVVNPAPPVAIPSNFGPSAPPPSGPFSPVIGPSASTYLTRPAVSPVSGIHGARPTGRQPVAGIRSAMPSGAVIGGHGPGALGGRPVGGGPSTPGVIGRNAASGGAAGTGGRTPHGRQGVPGVIGRPANAENSEGGVPASGEPDQLWGVGSGVAPVILPDTSNPSHDPGPGVIGRDK